MLRVLTAVFTALLPSLAGCGSSGITDLNRSDGIQVLFVGNSLTYWNDLPGMLQAMIDSADAGPATIVSVACGGYGLQDHWAIGPALPLIDEGGWDIVVLQQGPSATEGRPSLLEFSSRFDARIAQSGSRTALYMVWPSSQRLFDFDGVSDSYRTAAAQVDGLLFPAGEAWRAAWRRDPQLALYGPDGFHPSVEGTYLAALVMFEQLTGRSPGNAPRNLTSGTARSGGPGDLGDDLMPIGCNSGPGIPVTVNLSADLAELLQAAAKEANATFARP